MGHGAATSAIRKTYGVHVHTVLDVLEVLKYSVLYLESMFLRYFVKYTEYRIRIQGN